MLIYSGSCIIYMSALNEIRKFFQGLQTLYQTYLPNVDPILINDLLSRQQKNMNNAPFYMVEMFTEEGTDEEAKREFIIRKTGMAPAIYDKGTHYVTNQRLTLELLNELAEPEDVLEITGDYTGNLSGVGASHDYSGNPSGVGAGDEHANRLVGTPLPARSHGSRDGRDVGNDRGRGPGRMRRSRHANERDAEVERNQNGKRAAHDRMRRAFR